MSQIILDTVRSFVVEAFYASGDLADDASLLDTGTMDSTGVLELIVFVEKRWGFSVGDREIVPENFDSIRRIAAFVERAIADRSAAAPASSPRDSVAPSSASPLGGA